MTLRVKIGLFGNGERLPLLVDSDSGVPLFLPTVYCVTTLRARAKAVNTIDQAVRAILLLHASANRQRIDLYARIGSGQALTLPEIDGLAADARAPMTVLAGAPLNGQSSELQSPHYVRARLECSRLSARGPEEVPQIGLAFTANRLRFIRDYLDWLYLRQLGKTPLVRARQMLDVARAQTLAMLEARIPAAGNKGDLDAREGMSPEAVNKLRSVTEPESPENPWVRVHVRHRNRLIILWALYLGLRRGEMLGVRIDDIDFRKQEVTIRRRADDPNDPRRRQPNAKTRDRRLPLGPELVQLTEDYVMQHRKNEPGARRSSFLFVADRTGRPLSISGMTKVYEALRVRHPDLVADFSWHVLRHTWNDRFSETMDARGIPEEEEKKQRAYLMGWSDTSSTAANYTRRHIRNRARKASLELQESLLGKSTNGSE
jgi:integrase